MEGADAGAVGAVARATFKLANLRNFGVSVAPTIGTYRLLFGNQRGFAVCRPERSEGPHRRLPRA
jgi:hypothetical protein